MTEYDYITEERHKLLEDELKELKGPKRQEILDRLTSAKELGDLSENAEYHQARDEQTWLESTILKIENILKHSKIVSSTKGKTIGIGSNVVLIKEGENTKKNFTIVGSEESNITLGKISYKSPLGKVILGKEVNNVVSCQTPKGAITYKIVSIN